MNFMARANLVLAILALLIVGVYWSVRAARQPLIDQLRQSVVQKVLAVSGAVVPFDIGLATADPPRFANGRHLLLVGADDCAAMPDELPRWLDLLKSLPFGPNDSVILVTRGERIATVVTETAEGANVAIQVVQKDDTTAWARRTGMTATPSAFAVDDAGRVRLCLRTLNTEERETLAAFFRGAQLP